MHRQRYQFSAVEVLIRSEEADTHDAVREVFSYFGIQPRAVGPYEEVGDPQVRLDVREALTGMSIPKEAPGMSQVSPRVWAWQADDVFYLSDGMSSFQLDRATHRGCLQRFTVQDTEEGKWRLLELLVLGLLILLREKGLFPLHAAALCQEASGVLIVADSDCGKSTMAYSLVRQGWHYLSDDAILLHQHGSSVEAIPFRRRFGLDVEAGEFFPELRRDWTQPFTEEDKWAVSLDTLFPSQSAEQCVPQILVFPKIVDRDVSEVVELSRAEALYEVVRQSALLAIAPETSRRQMAMLKSLIGQTRHYRVLGGRDLIEQPRRAMELLTPLLRNEKTAA